MRGAAPPARARVVLGASGHVAGVLLAFALGVSPAASETGGEAFSRGAYDEAARIWTREAAAGAPEAWLGLGVLADRGLGHPRDAALGFRRYFVAAEGGLAEAQFNVAVMLDAGIGTEPDLDAAMLWYGRAAIRGHDRARYNLGLLFSDPAGPFYNPGIAAHWFDAAAARLPAAGERIAALDAPTGALLAPDLRFAAQGGGTVEAVWTAPPGPIDSTFLVEAVAVPEPGGPYRPPVLRRLVRGSGLLAPVGDIQEDLAVRVSQVAPEAGGYAASPWILPGDATGPEGRVTFALPDGGVSAERFAAILSADLDRAGYWTRTRPIAASEAGTRTEIVYRYPSDADLARTVAALLPATDDDFLRLDARAALSPGEVVVRFGGGARAAAARADGS